MLTRSYIESETQSFTHSLFLNSLLALSIYLACWLGQALSIPLEKTAVSLVWPASGVAIAAILLMGYRSILGIFIGFIAYFITHPLFPSEPTQEILTLGTFLSIAATLQATIGGAIIRRYSTIEYFKTVRDTYIFLVPAGFFACLIASTAKTFTLFYTGMIQGDELGGAWLYAYIGQLFGLYIFTPLIVVWLTHKTRSDANSSFGEGVLMFICFILLTFLMTEMEWPLGQFYIPMCIWTTYRYKMHGATLINFLVTMTGIVPTIYSFGAWMIWISDNQVPIVVVYLGAIVSTGLILAAVLNERGRAQQLLENYNINLEEALDTQKTTLQELGTEIIVKNKLAYLGIIILSTARKMLLPLKTIFGHTQNNMKMVLEMRNLSEKQKLDPGINIRLSQLENSLEEISTLENQAMHLVHLIEKQSVYSSQLLNDAKNINLHTVLSQALDLMREIKEVPMITVQRSFSRTNPMITALPEDLSHAFNELVQAHISSIKRKYENIGIGFNPAITVTTIVDEGWVQVILKDNGAGLGPDQLQELQSTFRSGGEISTSSLAQANHIISYIHHGSVEVESKEGDSLEIRISLPISHEKVAKNKGLTRSLQ